MKKPTKQELELIKARSRLIIEQAQPWAARRHRPPLTEAEIRASFSFVDDSEELKKIIKKLTRKRKR